MTKTTFANFFGITLLSISSLVRAEITVTGLTNVTVYEGSPATFSVKAEAAPPVSYQWFRNREPIPGANTFRYIIPRTYLTNDVDLYSVVVSNETGKVTSEAVLSVLPDLAPPEIKSVLDLGASNQFAVFFSEGVESESTSKAENYSIDGLAAQSAEVIGSAAVRITMPKALNTGLHFLKVKNVRDLAVPPNATRAESVEVEAGLKVWLSFDEQNSMNATDFSNQFNHAALSGDPAPLTQGVRHAALRFDGSNDFAQLPEGMSDFVNGLTISVWAKPTAAKAWSRFVDFGNGAADDNIIFARMDNSPGLFFEVYSGRDTGGKVIATNAMTLNEWQHFAVTVNGVGRVSIFKNGELLAEGRTTPPRVLIRARNFIARSNWEWDQDQPYEGAMDELRVYERALSADEVKTLAAKN